jgi:2-keto-4-pentenoate hydratase/2-oxohepta-3-ene-1,7-dioic acid hydratase in catechol pathway
MKLAFYNDYRPAVVTDRGVVDITPVVAPFEGGSAQLTLENIIINWQLLRPRLERLAEGASAMPLTSVRLRSPVPRPGKVLNGRGNFMEGVPIEPVRPLSTFFKSPDAVIGPGDTIELPTFRPVIFHHEAELAFVVGQTAKNVSIASALDHVFGYTCAVDVSARAPVAGEPPLPGEYGKSFDTFLPVGPWIVTADEIPNPNKVSVQYRVNGQLRQDYNTSDMEHGVEYFLATLSHNMSLKPGDLCLVGTNHQGLGPLQDGDEAEISIEGIGKMTNYVVDSMKRTWPKEVDPNMGAGIRGRRESMRGTPSACTWPFTQPSGG